MYGIGKKRIYPKTLKVAIWDFGLSNHDPIASWCDDSERVGLKSRLGIEVKQIFEVKVPDGVFLAVDDLGRLCGSLDENGGYWLVDPVCSDNGEPPICMHGTVDWWTKEMEVAA